MCSLSYTQTFIYQSHCFILTSGQWIIIFSSMSMNKPYSAEVKSIPASSSLPRAGRHNCRARRTLSFLFDMSSWHRYGFKMIDLRVPWRASYALLKHAKTQRTRMLFLMPLFHSFIHSLLPQDLRPPKASFIFSPKTNCSQVAAGNLSWYCRRWGQQKSHNPIRGVLSGCHDFKMLVPQFLKSDSWNLPHALLVSLL